MARQGHIGLLSSGGDQINVNHESIKIKLATLLLLLPRKLPYYQVPSHFNKKILHKTM